MLLCFCGARCCSTVIYESTCYREVQFLVFQNYNVDAVSPFDLKVPGIVLLVDFPPYFWVLCKFQNMHKCTLYIIYMFRVLFIHRTWVALH